MRLLPSVLVNFKEVYTSNICKLNINPNWTTRQFLDNIWPHISRYFNTHNFEIVEAGKNTYDYPAEAAPSLQRTNIRLKDKWTETLNVSFYVRKLDSQLISPNIQIMSINPLIMNECPICLETLHLINRVGCSHQICAHCNSRCIRMGYTICPLCRHV